jgi:ABC-type multidrug transport system fused ATPase/permease subunit
LSSARIRAFLARLPADSPGRASEALWFVALASLATGLAAWGIGLASTSLVPGVTALWAFIVGAVAVAMVLPMPSALASPLYTGAVGWLVDMLPMVILVGWSAVLLRWGVSLLAQRRLPRGGRWIWLPIALFVWTAVGVVAVPRAELKHFLLLLGIQGLISGGLLCVVDVVRSEADLRAVSGALVGIVLVMTVVVGLRWLGVQLHELRDMRISDRVEETYGLDAFFSREGLIKHVYAENAGANDLRRELRSLAKDVPDLPPFDVFKPRSDSFSTDLVVRFSGSARPFADELEKADVHLLYDNVALSPANSVPRLRSVGRKALTYGGMCAAVFPFAFLYAWDADRRRRWLGRGAAAACLFGATYSFARSAWATVGIGALYLLIDAVIPMRRRLQVMAAVVAGAVIFTIAIYAPYGTSPFAVRSAGEASVEARGQLYAETIESVSSIHLLIGYGTERSRVEGGGQLARGSYGGYVPRAGTHSTYLNYLFRTGVPGLVMIFLVYLIAGLYARAAARVFKDDRRLLFTIVAMAVASIGAHAAVLSLYVEPLYSLTVTLIVGLASVAITNVRGSVLPWRAGT